MKRRRNPSKRSRLTQEDIKSLGVRRESISAFVEEATHGLASGESIIEWIEQGQKWEMSWAQIRKGLRIASNRVIMNMIRKSRRA